MNRRTLLILTIVSVVFATAAEGVRAVDVAMGGAAPAEVDASIADTLAADADIPIEPLADGVTIFYFHRTIRCETCLAAEAFADTLIRQEFAEMIERGELAWIVLDIDEEENAHFIDEYDPGLFGLVISVRVGGMEYYWKSLESVADLAAHRDLFNEYVLEEVRFAVGMLDDRAGGANKSKEDRLP